LILLEKGAFEVINARRRRLFFLKNEYLSPLNPPERGKKKKKPSKTAIF
jgi:hypothetical protein